MARSTYTRTESANGVAVVRIEREKVSDHEAAVVQTELLAAAAAHNHRVAIDLSQVNLLASPGLSALIVVDRECKSSGGRMAVFNVPAQLMDVFKITRLERLFTFAPTREEAVARVAGGS